jgi:hypothetical protein
VRDAFGLAFCAKHAGKPVRAAGVVTRAYTRPFVIDRRLGVTTQLADCEPHECNIGAPIAISDDGSTVALQDNAYLTNYAALMVHRLDASNHETQTFQKQIGWFDGQF